MSFRVITCEQGSPEWHQARAGVITASMFKVARQKVGGLDERQSKYVEAIRSGKSELAARTIAGYKNAPTSETVQRAIAGEKAVELSETAKNYAFRVAFERISGEPMDEGFETYAMSRGHELEPEARREHQILEGVVVERAGFVCTEDYAFGASADGLIGTKGGAEYKCFMSPVSLRPVLMLNDVSAVIDQVQGCMWLTGRAVIGGLAAATAATLLVLPSIFALAQGGAGRRSASVDPDDLQACLSYIDRTKSSSNAIARNGSDCSV